MFKALHKAAQIAPVILRVTTEGEGLRLVIHQKADEMKDGQIPLALSVTGSVDMLEFELPAALHQALGTLQNAGSVADQVAAQTAAAVKTAAAEGNTGKSKQKSKPSTTKRKVNKPAVAKKPAASKPAAAPKPAKPTKHSAAKPTAEDCIKAYHEYAAANPGDIKRETFIKGNPTGRRFERLFGNWEKFIAAATKVGTINPPGDNLTKPLPLETAAATESAATAPARTGEATEAVPPAALSAADTQAKCRAVVDINSSDGSAIAQGVELAVETDQIITIEQYQLRVLDFNDSTIWVEHVNTAATAGATA